MRTCQESLVAGGEEDDAALSGVESFSFAVKPADVTALRTAASEITSSGARLHELMRREAEEVQEARGSALRFLEAASGNLNARAETEYVERSIHDAIAAAKVSVSVQLCLCTCACASPLVGCIEPLPRRFAACFISAVSMGIDVCGACYRLLLVALQDNISALERQLADLVEDEKTLEGKLAKKKQELARAQKRLESLSTVRPAFMDEYEVRDET